MEKEPPYNSSDENNPDFWKPAEPKDPLKAMEYLLYQRYQHKETVECPNCSDDMELMTGYKDDGAIDYQVLYCWNCGHAVDSSYGPSDGEDFNEDDAQA